MPAHVFFAIPRTRELVANALGFWNGKRYRLVAGWVMPNHVQVVRRLLPGHALNEVLRSWKPCTARMSNKILGRNGPFWQREYYDRLFGNEGEFGRATSSGVPVDTR